MRGIFFFVLLVYNLTLFSNSTEVTIFAFHDSFECSLDDEKSSLCQLMTLLEKERKSAKHHLTLINGDFISSPFFSHWDKGKYVIELLNEMKVDFACLGCHELNYGTQTLKEHMSQSSFGWLAANVIDQDDQTFTGKRQVQIFNFNQIKIGVFGLVDEKVIALSNSQEELFILPYDFVAKKIVKQLKKEGVDVIIALTNLSSSKDIQLAKRVPEIDVICGIHEDDPICWFENEIFIHKASLSSDVLTRIDLKIEKDLVPFHPDVKVYPVWRMISSKHFPEHTKLNSRLQKIQARHTSLYVE